MTREQARQFGISLLEGIAERNTGEYAENVRLAIAALTEPILVPDNLDEVVEKYANTHYGEFFEVEYDFGDPIEVIVDDKPFVRDAFKAGAEWMAEQGITVEGDIEGNWRNQEGAPYEIYVTSDCLPKDTEFKFGDKVVVQIRKK